LNAGRNVNSLLQNEKLLNIHNFVYELKLMAAHNQGIFFIYLPFSKTYLCAPKN